MPILANIQNYIPKVWKHAAERKPDMDRKFNEHAKLLMSRQYKTDELSKDKAVIWMETVYEMTEKMEKFMTTHDHIELVEHKKFYD